MVTRHLEAFLLVPRMLKYILTYSMVQRPSWEANWFAASQEIPRISRNPKVHYRTHKRLPHISILGPPNPVHTPTSHLLQIHPNIIHSSTPRPPQWFLSLWLPHQDPIHPPLLTHTRHMPSPSTACGKNTTCRIGRHQDTFVEKRTGTKCERQRLENYNKEPISKKSVQYMVISRRKRTKQ